MKAAAVGLVVAIVVKGLILTGGGYSVYAVSTVLSNEIWFVLGMSICVFDVQLKGRKVQGSGKIAFIFSISIEMLQLLLRLGTFQLSDIFYNTVGGVLGGLMYCVVMKARKRL